MEEITGDSGKVFWKQHIIKSLGATCVVIVAEIEDGGNKEEKEFDLMCAFSEFYADILESIDNT